jgi:hypothetical protein
VKVIQKHLLPQPGGFGSLCVSPDAKIVGVDHEGEQLFAYIESHASGYGYVYWEVQVVREGESYADGMQYLGMSNDPQSPVQVGGKFFVVGRING